MKRFNRALLFLIGSIGVIITVPVAMLIATGHVPEAITFAGGAYGLYGFMALVLCFLMFLSENN